MAFEVIDDKLLVKNTKRKRIHINRHVMARNKKQQEDRPAIGVEILGMQKVYGHSVSILGPSRVIHAEDKPLKCGARAWVETTAPVVVTP